jgi:hypothetical protein
MTAAALSARFKAARAAQTPPYALLAAGPQGDLISRWGTACALALAPGLPGAPNMRCEAIGGLDGVTGANHFDAFTPPDGSSAGLFPGATLIAWLTGDSRVHFDPIHWVPVMGASNSGVLVVRLAPQATPSRQTLAARGPLKLAACQPESRDLAALLALACMGVPIEPVFGLNGTDAKTRAFLSGDADAVFVCGEGVPEDLAPLSANGGVPVFSLGRMGDDGVLGPDPLFPGLPDVMQFGEILPATSLASALAASAAAARLDFLMTLPHLTDPNAVAFWQQAAIAAIATPALASAADASAVALRAAPGAAAELAAIALNPAQQGVLRQFLRARYPSAAS